MMVQVDMEASGGLHSAGVVRFSENGLIKRGDSFKTLSKLLSPVVIFYGGNQDCGRHSRIKEKQNEK